MSTLMYSLVCLLLAGFLLNQLLHLMLPLAGTLIVSFFNVLEGQVMLVWAPYLVPSLAELV